MKHMPKRYWTATYRCVFRTHTNHYEQVRTMRSSNSLW